MPLGKKRRFQWASAHARCCCTLERITLLVSKTWGPERQSIKKRAICYNINRLQMENSKINSYKVCIGTCHLAVNLVQRKKRQRNQLSRRTISLGDMKTAQSYQKFRAFNYLKHAKSYCSKSLWKEKEKICSSNVKGLWCYTLTLSKSRKYIINDLNWHDPGYKMCSNITPLKYVYRLDLPNFFLHLDSGFNVKNLSVTEKLLGEYLQSSPY